VKKSLSGEYRDPRRGALEKEGREGKSLTRVGGERGREKLGAGERRKKFERRLDQTKINNT